MVSGEAVLCAALMPLPFYLPSVIIVIVLLFSHYCLFLGGGEGREHL